VLLDNQVLDVGQFDKFHPGGKFVFEKNFGRDITKFFNGAYMLVSSDPKEI
jgi:cytochrome b involved in lipid metabolism